MTTRTTSRTVTFAKPFILAGLDEVLPPGVYTVDTDEDLLEGVSFPAYRRVATVIHLHAHPGKPGISRSWAIDPNELEDLLQRDSAVQA